MRVLEEYRRQVAAAKKEESDRMSPQIKIMERALDAARVLVAMYDNIDSAQLSVRRNVLVSLGHTIDIIHSVRQLLLDDITAQQTPARRD